jgi:hypothetical protein
MTLVVSVNGIPTEVPSYNELNNDQKLWHDLGAVAVRNEYFAKRCHSQSYLNVFGFDFRDEVKATNPTTETGQAITAWGVHSKEFDKLCYQAARRTVLGVIRAMVQHGFRGADKKYDGSVVKYVMTHVATGKKFTISLDRSAVCKRVEVGEETITRKEYDTITREITETVPKYEWICS